MAYVTENITFNEKLLHIVSAEVVENAEASGLRYVTSGQPGFSRRREGDMFFYFDGKKKLRNKEHLNRIKSLVLPPAWENVWICRFPNGHMQATGFDKLNRKQYRYHNTWIKIRNQTKFNRMLEFGEVLPQIRKKLEKDLSVPGFPQNKVLAAMISLLERINIRVGNSSYEKLYGSFGLTTLKNHHVKINGTRLHLMFKGKKGVRHNITFSSRRLSRIIKGCKEIPGKELFEYFDEEGNIRPVDSGMVNDYIRFISDSDFTAKDFRTWAGSVQSIIAFREVGHFLTTAEMNHKIPAALDIVAEKLGNTRSVCKKYYVHPLILDLYQEKKLDKYLSELDKVESRHDDDGYVAEERVLLKILRSAHAPHV